MEEKKERPARRESRFKRAEDDGTINKLIQVNRGSKTVKGGRKMRIAALVVEGDGKGSVGCGVGKAEGGTAAVRRRHVVFKRRDGGVGEAGIEIAVRLQSEQIRHRLRAAVKKRGALGNGRDAALARLRAVPALHADGVLFVSHNIVLLAEICCRSGGAAVRCIRVSCAPLRASSLFL